MKHLISSKKSSLEGISDVVSELREVTGSELIHAQSAEQLCANEGAVVTPDAGC